ncbi:hypothetical protein BH24ACT2_BH24ACT2_16000 [soil metagenome]
MTRVEATLEELRSSLTAVACPEAARSIQCYFPGGICALGVGNSAVRAVADSHVRAHPELTVSARLEAAERLLEEAHHHEEVILAFALIGKLVERHFDDDLLDRFLHWLEHFVSNWAQCDDLCLKIVYPYFMGHPHLIISIGHWSDSPSVWARRAGNVALVKLVRRTIRGERYELPLEVIFGNASRLLDDPEIYVQKSVGWLLKVASQIHPDEVITYLEANIAEVKRETLRTAIEKLDPQARRSIMALRGSRVSTDTWAAPVTK